MVADFRSQRMPSPEGRGLARSRWQRAWDAYSLSLKRASEPLARPVAVTWTEELVGFWLMWHLEGGFEGLQRLGMSRSAIYRRVSAFRRMFGAHPDEFTLPGVSLDVETYLAGRAAVAQGSGGAHDTP